MVLLLVALIGYGFLFLYIAFDSRMDELKDEMKSRFEDLEKAVKGMKF